MRADLVVLNFVGLEFVGLAEVVVVEYLQQFAVARNVGLVVPRFDPRDRDGLPRPGEVRRIERGKVVAAEVRHARFSRGHPAAF